MIRRRPHSTVRIRPARAYRLNVTFDSDVSADALAKSTASGRSAIASPFTFHALLIARDIPGQLQHRMTVGVSRNPTKKLNN
jgi:hypothetical protein